MSTLARPCFGPLAAVKQEKPDSPGQALRIPEILGEFLEIVAVFWRGLFLLSCPGGLKPDALTAVQEDCS